LACRLNLVLGILPFGRCFITIIEVGRAIFGIGPCYCLYGSCQVFLLLLKFNHLWCFCVFYRFLTASMVWSFFKSKYFLNWIAFEFHTMVSMVLQCSNWAFLQWPWTMNFLAMVEKKCMNFLKKWEMPSAKHLKTLSYRFIFLAFYLTLDFGCQIFIFWRSILSKQ
jgi:hypothetical protein